MSVEMSATWQDLDLTITITEWEEEDLFPLSGVIEIDGVGKTNSLQDLYLKSNAEFISKYHDKVFDEIFTSDKNINMAHIAVSDHLEEEESERRLESEIDRDIQENGGFW